MKEVKLRTFPCHHCDFSSGQRGTDRCSKCDGTGSLLILTGLGDPKHYPNTEEGSRKAEEHKNKFCTCIDATNPHCLVHGGTM